MRIAVPGLFLCALLHGATGVPQPQLSAFDYLMNGLLAKGRIAGGALGVSRHGRLVMARGYGVTNTGDGQPVQPDSPFRVAGLSKTLAAAAILRLAEDVKVPLAGGAADPHTLTSLIEKASGQSYESYVTSAILLPLGISRLQIGDDTTGGLASVIDLLRLSNALEGRRPPMLLKSPYAAPGWIIGTAGV